jgi:hypothetical protein
MGETSTNTAAAAGHKGYFSIQINRDSGQPIHPSALAGMSLIQADQPDKTLPY